MASISETSGFVKVNFKLIYSLDKLSGSIKQLCVSKREENYKIWNQSKMSRISYRIGDCGVSGRQRCPICI